MQEPKTSDNKKERIKDKKLIKWNTLTISNEQTRFCINTIQKSRAAWFMFQRSESIEQITYKKVKSQKIRYRTTRKMHNQKSLIKFQNLRNIKRIDNHIFPDLKRLLLMLKWSGIPCFIYKTTSCLKQDHKAFGRIQHFFERSLTNVTYH